MYRVAWATDHCGFRERWFEGRAAAVRFYRRKAMAVMFDPAGERCK